MAVRTARIEHSVAARRLVVAVQAVPQGFLCRGLRGGGTGHGPCRNPHHGSHNGGPKKRRSRHVGELRSYFASTFSICCLTDSSDWRCGAFGFLARKMLACSSASWNRPPFVYTLISISRAFGSFSSMSRALRRIVSARS